MKCIKKPKGLPLGFLIGRTEKTHTGHREAGMRFLLLRLSAKKYLGGPFLFGLYGGGVWLGLGCVELG